MALEVYRNQFQLSDILDKPYVIASFGVMAADDKQQADRESWAYSHAMMRMTTRRSFVVPTAKEAENYNYSETERRIIDMWDAKTMSGTGEQVVEQLNAWQERIHADELMLLNLGIHLKQSTAQLNSLLTPTVCPNS